MIYCYSFACISVLRPIKKPGIVASDVLSYCFCMNYDYYVLLKSSVVMEMVEMVRFSSKILYYY